MTTKLTLTNQPGDASHSGLTFHAYIVEQGETLRYGKPARSRTVEIYDARHDRGAHPEREGQFVADYYAETLLADRERLANGLSLYGSSASPWTLDGEAVTALLDALT